MNRGPACHFLMHNKEIATPPVQTAAVVAGGRTAIAPEHGLA
jgi:hypothetical protein